LPIPAVTAYAYAASASHRRAVVHCRRGTVRTKSGMNGAITLCCVTFSGYAGHATIFYLKTAECLLTACHGYSWEWDST